MSIWATCYSLDIPPRDKYGNEDDIPPPPGRPHRQMLPGESAIDVATSPNMSTVIRLSLMESLAGSDNAPRHVDAETLLTPDEAHHLADALHAAADEYTTASHDG